jgi:hypothetical protein
VAGETIETLGDEPAWHLFANVGHDLQGVQFAVRETYPQTELVHSLVMFYFHAVPKDVYWFQLLLLCGNYPLLRRTLRFTWEAIFRAYHADTYFAPSSPGLFPDDKITWLEREPRHWGNTIKPGLQKLLPPPHQGQIDTHYHDLWDGLNQYVHPSKEVLYRSIDESALLIRNAFDEAWAKETIQVATEVLDLVASAVVARFPNCIPLLAQRSLGRFLPLTLAFMETATAR